MATDPPLPSVAEGGDPLRPDLRSEAAATLRGRLVVDGEPAVGWSVGISHRHAFNVVDPIRPVLSGADGSFEVQAPAGPYKITCTPPDGFEAVFIASGEAELKAGETASWELVWDWAWLVPGSEPLAPTLTPRLFIGWRGPAGQSVRIEILREESGAFARTPVSAGRLMVHETRRTSYSDPDGRRHEYESWFKLGELEAGAGETFPCAPSSN